MWMQPRFVKDAPNNHLFDANGQPQPDADPLQPLTVEQRALACFALSPDASYSYEELQNAYDEHVKHLYAVCKFLQSAGEFATDALVPKKERATAMIEMVYHGFLSLFANHRARLLLEGRRDALAEPPANLLSLRFSTCYDLNVNGEKPPTPFQALLLFLLDQIYLNGFRRFNDACYRQIKTREGHGTHAWERVNSIEEFVFSCVRKEDHFAMWCNLTANPNNGQKAVDFLKVTNDLQFPVLKKDRHVFAFSNGIYLAEKDKFLPYWVEEGQGECVVRDLESSVVACHYFDNHFTTWEEYGELGVQTWYDIPTVAFQSILDYQELGMLPSSWMYIFIGRMIYWLNEIDCWQVIPFIKGTAGSGKSTLLSLVKAFFEAGDVGVLSNNIEKQFGLSQFYDKFLFIAPEIKRDFSLDQAEFQSVVSGEDMVVAQKFKKPVSLVWRVPGILAGNEVPDWVDNSGSISRRVVVFHFGKKVTQSNPHLAKRLREEIPALILKCNMGYSGSVMQFGQDDCWKHLPDYFKETQRQMAQSTNALQSFLASDQVVLQKDYFVPQSEFVRALRAYAIANNYPLGRWEADSFMSIFLSLGLSIQQDDLCYPRIGGRPKRCNYIIGCDLTSALAAPALAQNNDAFPIAPAPVVAQPNPLNQLPIAAQ
jgi:hypothetical protein